MSVRTIRTSIVVLLMVLVAACVPPAAAQDDATAVEADDATNQRPQDVSGRGDRLTAVYKLEYAEAEAISNVLRLTFADMDDQLTLAVDEASNSLVVSATEKTAKEIQLLLDKLDSPEMQLQPGARSAARVLKMFRLRNALATEAAATISELYANRLDGRRGVDESLSVAADERANYVIVHAPPKLLDEIATVLQEIDAKVSDAKEMAEEADDADSPRFHLFYLKHVEAEAASRMLASLLSGGDVRIVADQRINALYVHANAADQRIVASLLETIDIESGPEGAPTNPAAGSQRRLLFYWLASGPEFSTGRGIPQQLEHVVEELQNLGLENVQLVSRSVAALDGRNVSLHSIVSAGNYTSLDLVLEGHLTSGGEETPRLDLNVRATHAEDVSHVETTITAPYNHFVVLGTTGLGNLENAFVIQIQSIEPARQESGQRQ